MEIFNPIELKIKKPPGRPSKRPIEYMLMVARKVVEEGMTYREAAKTFGVSHGAVHTAILKYKGKKHNKKRTERESKYAQQVNNYRHEVQIKELKQEIAELYLENQMLKKALQHSVQIEKENSSVITSENLEELQGGAE